MFGGDDTARLTFAGSTNDFYDRVEDCLSPLGDVRVTKHGEIDIHPRGMFKGTLVQTRIEGDVQQRKSGEYEVYLNYSCGLTVVGWIVCIVFFPVGLLALMAPSNMKSEVDRQVRRVFRELEDEADGGGDRRSRR